VVYAPQNSASYATFTIAQGSIFVARGTNLGPVKLVEASPLTLQLAGTSVTVNVGGATIQCPMVYTSAAQIAAILPSNTPIGSGTFYVTYNGQAGSRSDIRVVKSAVGIYTASSSGAGHGIVTGADYVLKTPAKPARTGEVVIAWVTGLGPVDGGDTTPKPGQQFPETEVFLGDRSAKVIYAGRSGCCAGLDQIVFEVPEGPRSCFVPLSIRTPGGSSNFVTVPISSGGEPCENTAPGIPSSALSKSLGGGPVTIGFLGIGPIAVLQGAGFSFAQGIADQMSKILRMPVPEADVVRLVRSYRARNMAAVQKIVGKYSSHMTSADVRVIRNIIRSAISKDQKGAAAIFIRSSGSAAMAPQFGSNFPAVGSCMVTTRFPTDSTFRTRPLDAGTALTVDGPSGRKTLTRISNGQYQVLLGPGGTLTSTAPGIYTVTGTGGKDVGAFAASINVTSPLVWTNKSAVSEVDRTRPLTLTWSGGSAAGYVLIGGTASGGFSGSALFTCVEETRKEAFTVPQFVLSALPVAKEGTIFVAPHPLSNPVTIPGLDLAFLGDGSNDSRELAIR